MESPVEIRYAGVVIGRAQEIRGGDGDSSFFLVVRDPMPVGSVVHLRTGDRETPARVVHAVESADAAAAGIQVRLIGESEEVATEWIPPPAPVVEKVRPVEEPPKTAMPVIEVAMPVAPPKVAVGVDTRLRSEDKQTDFAFTDAPAAEAAPVPEAAPAAEAAPVPEAAPAAEAAPAPEAAPEATPVSVPPAEPVAAVVAEEAPIVATAPYGQAAPAAATSSATETSDGVVQVPIEHKLVDSASEAAAPTADVPAPAAPAASENAAPVGDLPPARPIAGPSGRRKTKRRR